MWHAIYLVLAPHELALVVQDMHWLLHKLASYIDKGSVDWLSRVE